jgi:membrane protein implicated in regulation of membrane protease activity
MPVRFNGKKDLIGMFLLLFMPAIIAMVIALFMGAPWTIIILLTLTALLSIYYLYKRRKKPKA